MSYEENEVTEGAVSVIDTEERGQIALVATAEINQQIATAKKYPRDLKKFINETNALATMDPEIAGECFYRLERKDKNNEKVIIEGPSARFAEIIASTWGNCRAAARVIEETDKFIVAQGAFIDLERNVAITYETRRGITTRAGKKFGADMIGMTSNGACSIALRNAVLKGVPKAFWIRALENAQKCYRGDVKGLAIKRDDWKKYWAKSGVSDERLFAKIGKRNWEEVDLDDCVSFRGFATAIKDGDCTIDECFPAPQAPIDPNKSKADQLADQLAENGKKEQPPKEVKETETDRVNRERAEANAREQTAEPVNQPAESQQAPTGETVLSAHAQKIRDDFAQAIEGQDWKTAGPAITKVLRVIDAQRDLRTLSTEEHKAIYDFAQAQKARFGK